MERDLLRWTTSQGLYNVNLQPYTIYVDLVPPDCDSAKPVPVAALPPHETLSDTDSEGRPAGDADLRSFRRRTGRSSWRAPSKCWLDSVAEYVRTLARPCLLVLPCAARVRSNTTSRRQRRIKMGPPVATNRERP